jgi:cytoskeletal protein CcmA (bactofilin family)
MWDKKDGSPPVPGKPIPRSTAPGTADYIKGRPVNIGPSILIKGELTGMEDLTIDGTVEGKIELRDHNLVVGPNGKIKADIYGKTITITGEVRGNAYASHKVEIGETGTLHGDIVAPRIAIADGAHFKGSVEMSSGTRRENRTGKDAGRKSASAPDETRAQSASTQGGGTFRDLN